MSISRKVTATTTLFVTFKMAASWGCMFFPVTQVVGRGRAGARRRWMIQRANEAGIRPESSRTPNSYHSTPDSYHYNDITAGICLLATAVTAAVGGSQRDRSYLAAMPV